MGRLPKNPYRNSGRLFKTIKELIANSTEDRNLALEVFKKAKGDLELAADPMDRDSLRKLQVETLKLAQSSKAASIKAIELFIKHQESAFDGAGDAAKEAVEEGFLGDG